MADGVRRPCGEVRLMQRNGLADACETGDCGPAVVRDKKGNEYFAPLGRDPNTGGLGYWFRFITQTSSTVEGETEHYPGRPAVMWVPAQGSTQNPTPEESAATRAAELLQRSRCADFVRSVYDNAIAIAGGRVSPFGITPTADVLLGLDGRPLPLPPTSATVSLDAYKEALAAGRVSASGTNQGTAAGQTSGFRSIVWHKIFYDLDVDDRARHTIHEGYHMIPNIDDFVLLAAGARAAGIKTPKAKDHTEASRLFNSLLFERCDDR
jgi:hypothetical protein